MIETTKLDTEELMVVIKRLISLLQTEIELIKVMKFTEVRKLQDEKIKLTSVVEDYKDFIHHNPDILAGIPPRVLEDMKRVNAEFEQLIAEDGKQLLKARKIHALTMEAIRKVLEDRRRREMTYNKGGFFGEGKKHHVETQPFQISESI